MSGINRQKKMGVFIQLTRYAHHLFKGFVTFIDLNPPGYPSHSCCLDAFSMLFFFFSPAKFDYCYVLSMRYYFLNVGKSYA